jgi:hypothetical protein
MPPKTDNIIRTGASGNICYDSKGNTGYISASGRPVIIKK